MSGALGASVRRREAWDKVTGKAAYAGDLLTEGVLYGRLLTSRFDHARITDLDILDALSSPGVVSVVTGADCPERTRITARPEANPKPVVWRASSFRRSSFDSQRELLAAWLREISDFDNSLPDGL